MVVVGDVVMLMFFAGRAILERQIKTEELEASAAQTAALPGLLER